MATPYQDTYAANAAARQQGSSYGRSPMKPASNGRPGAPSAPGGARPPAQPAAPKPPPKPAAGPVLPPIRSVTAAPPPTSDAQFSAFLRGLGQQEGSAWANTAMQLSQGRSNTDVRLSDLASALSDRNRGIDLGYESRGFGRSGMELKDLAFARRDYDRDVASTNLAWAQQQAQIRAQLQDQLAALARQRAEAELELLTRNEARKAAGVKVP